MDWPHDARFAIRLFRKSPAPTILAILAAALGIGANTAIFSVIRSVLLRPLPYTQPDRLVAIGNSNRGAGFVQGSSTGDYLAWREQNQVFSNMAAFAEWVPAGVIDGELERLFGEHVSASFFETLGVRPALGREFTEQEDQLGRNSVVILSDGFWAQRFGRDPAVIGQKILLDNAPYTIVGVMPRGFLPPNINQARRPVQFWRPLAEWDPGNRSRDIWVIGRLKPGVTIEMARAQMLDLARRLGRIYPEDAGWETDVTRLDIAITGWFARPLWILSAAAALLLLIACANIANLLLERATVRRQEFAIRAALGGGRARLFRQVLAEGVLLSGCGGALAILLALWTERGLTVMTRAFVPGDPAIRLDLPVFAFAALISTLAGLAFGSIPAFQSARVAIGEALKSGSRTTSGRAARVRSVIVMGEVALTFALLTGAALLLNSFRRIQSVDLGFRQDHLLVGDVRLRRGQDESPGNLSFMSELLESVQRLPGVQSAAVAQTPPLSGGGRDQPFLIEGRPALGPGELQTAKTNFCTLEYFRLLEMRLTRGRLFDQHDGPDTPRVIVINQAMARRYFPNEDPIGRRMKLTPPGWQTVVGIVSDMRPSITGEPAPEVYFPYAQHPLPRMALVVRAYGDPAGLFQAIRGEMSRMHPSVPLARAETMDEAIAQMKAPDRLITLLVACCAGLAIVLAAVGIYAVMSYSVAERTREIGVRIALGARPFDVVALIVRQGGLVAGIGLLAGWALSMMFSRLLRAFLYEVGPHDPATLAAAAGFLAAVAMVAIVVPALKAARCDPVVAIRSE